MQRFLRFQEDFGLRSSSCHLGQLSLFLVEEGLVALGKELDLGFEWLVVVVVVALFAVVVLVVVVDMVVAGSFVVGIAVVDTVVVVDMVAVGNLVAGMVVVDSLVVGIAVDIVVDRILVVGNLVVACSFVHILGSSGVGRLR
jgi:hypothetical protein